MANGYYVGIINNTLKLSRYITRNMGAGILKMETILSTPVSPKPFLIGAICQEILINNILN